MAHSSKSKTAIVKEVAADLGIEVRDAVAAEISEPDNFNGIPETLPQNIEEMKVSVLPPSEAGKSLTPAQIARLEAQEAMKRAAELAKAEKEEKLSKLSNTERAAKLLTTARNSRFDKFVGRYAMAKTEAEAQTNKDALIALFENCLEQAKNLPTSNEPSSK